MIFQIVFIIADGAIVLNFGPRKFLKSGYGPLLKEAGLTPLA